MIKPRAMHHHHHTPLSTVRLAPVIATVALALMGSFVVSASATAVDPSATPEPSASPSVSATPEPSTSPSPTATPEAPAAPIVMKSGKVNVTASAISAGNMRVVGTASFTSTGDVASLDGAPLMATVKVQPASGSASTYSTAATLVSDAGGKQAWLVRIGQYSRGSGTVTVSLAGKSASAAYAKVATRLSGAGGTVSKTAGTTWTRKVTVAPAYGRAVQLQAYRSGKWVTIATATTAVSASASVTFTFKGSDSSWYATNGKSFKYRVVAPATGALGSMTSLSLTVVPQMVYKAAAGRIQPVSAISNPDGGYDLHAGRNGTKVKAVQRQLGMGSRWETMDYATVLRVKNFQRSKGLSATGVVNKTTWLAMGLSEGSWYSLGTYTHPMVATRTSTREQRIEIMIDVAETYIGSDYVWGGAATPTWGADCSGMVMQAMYAAGMPTSGTNTVKHSEAGFRSTRALYNGNYVHVPLSQAKRGDLIFFAPRGRGASSIYHVAIYLGGGKMIEMTSVAGTARVSSIHVHDRYSSIISQVVRPFS